MATAATPSRESHDVRHCENARHARSGRPKQDLLHDIADADALLVRSATKVTKDVIEAAPRLKIIARAGSGVDNVDLEAASARGVIVTNAPGGNKKPVIGVSFDTLQTEYWVASRDAIAAEVKARGGEMLEAVANNDANRQLEQVNNFIAKGVDGIIIAGSTPIR